MPNILTARDRLVAGLLCVAFGLLLILVAIDIIPLRRVDDMSDSYSLYPATGAIATLLGIVVLTGGSGPGNRVAALTGYATLIVYAAIGNWIAFGPGPRQCNPEIVSIFAWFAEATAGIECRIAFGIGAGLLDGFVFIRLAQGLRQTLGAGLLPDVVERAGWGIVVIALLPVLVPFFLAFLIASAWEAFREYRKTGKWQRKADLMARMRKGRGDA